MARIIFITVVIGAVTVACNCFLCFPPSACCVCVCMCMRVCSQPATCFLQAGRREQIAPLALQGPLPDLLGSLNPAPGRSWAPLCPHLPSPASFVHGAAMSLGTWESPCWSRPPRYPVPNGTRCIRGGCRKTLAVASCASFFWTAERPHSAGVLSQAD